MIKRLIEPDITKHLLSDHQVIIVYGPRRVGKTTLINHILDSIPLKSLRINAEEPRYAQDLSSRDVARLTALVGGYDLVFIDEAQHIENAGLVLKLIHDHIPQVKVIASGSSSFDLSQRVTEPLTGRKWTYTLLPISYQELAAQYNQYELGQQLAERLVWGSYPDIFNYSSLQSRRKYLTELSTDYLYRDVIQLTDIRNANKIRDLLRLLSYQVGSEVSLQEIGSQLDMSKDTVARYIDLLEKSFVLFRLTGYSHNLRKEVSKMNKYYFYDLGVRNILIDDVKTLDLRNDVGQLWENFLIIERLKKNLYAQSLSHPYFWRVYTGGEIDYVETYQKELRGFEFKYAKRHVASPPSWHATYPEATYSIIHQENFLDFVG